MRTGKILLQVLLIPVLAWVFIVGKTHVKAEDLPVHQEEPVVVASPTPFTEEEQILKEENQVEEQLQDQEIEVDNVSDVENTVVALSQSGENQIIVSSPSPTPTTGPEEKCVEIVVDGENELDNGSADSQLDTDEEDLQQTSSQPSPVSQILSENAVSEIEVRNDINTTISDSEVIFQTINIYLPEKSNITFNPMAILEDVMSGEMKNREKINVRVVDVNNWTYVENDIISEAVSGKNSIATDGDATIISGNAYSTVSLLNNINTVIVNSKLHALTINIYNYMEGNIILPEPDWENLKPVDGITDVWISNESKIDNEIDSMAISGGNSISTVQGESDITSGDSVSLVNITNIANTTFVNEVYYKLVINVLGEWTGNFLGINGMFEKTPGGSGIFETELSNRTSFISGCQSDLKINNGSNLTNSVISSAVSGENSISGEGNGVINSGSAKSTVSITNFVNSSIIDSFLFIGYINIFDGFSGDIGGTTDFEDKIPDENQIEENGNQPVGEINQEDVSMQEDSNKREDGGLLEVEQRNNVGDYVYPGDTVTFFINVYNRGHGNVYESKMSIYLINEKGENVGGGVFDLGEIEGASAFGISTGLVLADSSKPGNYIARISVWGLVGEDHHEVSDHSDSYFTIRAKRNIAPAGITDQVLGSGDTEEIHPEVFSSTGTVPFEKKLIFSFIGLLSVYIPAKSYQKREFLYSLFSKTSKAVLPKLLAFRSLLGSFFA